MIARATIATVVATGMAFAGAMTAMAAEPHSTKQPPAEVTSFLHEAAMGGMAEVELGKLAQSHAANAKVKQFGKRMVTDHGKANAELKRLAAKKGVELPKGIGSEHQAMRNQLAELHGAEFDKAYIDDMKTDHAKDIDAFKQAAESSPDKDVRAFAKKTLPTLESHARQVEQVQSTLSSAAATPRHASRGH
jgi:putative membrane protein